MLLNMIKNKPIILVLGIVFVIIIGGSIVSKNFRNQSNLTPSPTPITTSTPTPTIEIDLGQQPTTNPTQNGPCGNWISLSNYTDILIKLNFADGVVKDTSYETGFALSSITRTARLARKEEYCTGFSYEELKNKGVVQVAVWGYTDSNHHQLANEPINVTFDENGIPDKQGIIEVTVLD